MKILFKRQQAILRSQHRSLLRSKRNNYIIPEKQGKYIDVWLSRISHFSQFGLFVITLGSLYFVVLPLYQKAILDEAIARKEIELKESERLVELSYSKIRSYGVKQFVSTAGFKCILLIFP